LLRYLGVIRCNAPLCLLTRRGKLRRRRLEISACLVRFVPDLAADLQLM
jgi:hypothetical protein